MIFEEEVRLQLHKNQHKIETYICRNWPLLMLPIHVF